MNLRRSRSSSSVINIERAVVEAARRKEATMEKAIEQQKLLEPQRIIQQSVERRKNAVRRTVPIATASAASAGAGGGFEEAEIFQVEPEVVGIGAGGFDANIAGVANAHEAKVRLPVLNRYDDVNKMEYGLFLTEDDITQHVETLRAIMGTPVNSFQHELAQRFVNAQNIRTPGQYAFSWHETVTPVSSSDVVAYNAKALPSLETTNEHWIFVKTYFDMRRQHIENFLLPIIRSSCSPHCTFQNVGSDNLTADIDISVMSTRGGILKYMANYITRVIYNRLGFRESVSLENGVVVTFNLGDLSSLMDTNVYPTGWYNICNNTSIAPFESCMSTIPDFFEATKPGHPFISCQLMWSMVRYVYALKHEQDKQDSLPEEGHYFRFIKNLKDVLENNTIDNKRSAAVEFAAQYLEENYPEGDEFYDKYTSHVVRAAPANTRAVRFSKIPYLTSAMVEKISEVLARGYAEYIQKSDAVIETDINAFTNNPGKRTTIKNFIAARKTAVEEDWKIWDKGSEGFFKVIVIGDAKMNSLEPKLYNEALRRVGVLHKIRGARKTQKVLAFLVQSVERCLRNYQTRTHVINGIFFAKQKKLEKEVEEDRKLTDPLLQDRATLNLAKATKINTNGGIFDTTKSFGADLEDMHKRIQTAFHFEYFTLQSMLYSFEEEAYLSIGAYLHVVVQEQKGFLRDTYLGQNVYWMSFFDNLGFFYETHKLKYFDRMVNAILRICVDKTLDHNTVVPAAAGATPADNAERQSKVELVKALKDIQTFGGVTRTSKGFLFINHCIDAFNHYAKTIDMNKCYRLLLSNESFEIGDIVVERSNPAKVFIVTGYGTGETEVKIQEFGPDIIDRRVVKLINASEEKNIRDLRKKNIGFTIVPENYTFTNM